MSTAFQLPNTRTGVDDIDRALALLQTVTRSINIATDRVNDEREAGGSGRSGGSGGGSAGPEPTGE